MQKTTCLMIGVLCCAAGSAAEESQAASTPCAVLNRNVTALAGRGQFRKAEITLRDALSTASASGTRSACAWIELQDMAVVLSRSGRLEEAENYALRSLAALDSDHNSGERSYLGPLHTLASVRLQAGWTAGAREALRRMEKVRTDSPLDHALIHATSARLLQAEGQYEPAESQYLIAITAWKKAGVTESVDLAAVYNGLADLYISSNRLKEARHLLDQVRRIYATAPDAGVPEHIRALNSEGVLHAREGLWPNAERDLRSAVALADTEAEGLNPSVLEPVLTNYAQVLRVNHRTQEARAMEARIAALPASLYANAVVDASQLAASRMRRER